MFMNLAGHPCYVRIELVTDHLSSECRARLEFQGVTCLDEAEPSTAYGIVEDDEELIQQLEDDPEVRKVDRHDPPSCK